MAEGLALVREMLLLWQKVEKDERIGNLVREHRSIQSSAQLGEHRSIWSGAQVRERRSIWSGAQAAEAGGAQGQCQSKQLTEIHKIKINKIKTVM